MTAFIILTFLVLCGLSLPHLQPANWGIVDWDNVEWRPFINVMFWCGCGNYQWTHCAAIVYLLPNTGHWQWANLGQSSVLEGQCLVFKEQRW
jgi:hypothetical protein